MRSIVCVFLFFQIIINIRILLHYYDKIKIKITMKIKSIYIFIFQSIFILQICIGNRKWFGHSIGNWKAAMCSVFSIQVVCLTFVFSGCQHFQQWLFQFEHLDKQIFVNVYFHIEHWILCTNVPSIDSTTALHSNSETYWKP